MSRLARQKLHFTKLRDFGAFQDDIALLDTNKVGAIDRSMVQERPNSSEHVLFSAHADAVQAFFQFHIPIFLAQPFYIRELLDTVRKYTYAPALEE